MIQIKKIMIMSLGLLKKTIIIYIFSTSTFAEPLIGEFAHFKLLDKITNKVTQKAIAVNSSIKWDSLNIKVHACFFSKPEELPEDYVLLEIKDLLKPEKDNFYMGWMISSAPDLTPLEHPIYDLWLIDCKIDNAS